ncbi:MAG: glycosyltransferase family 39 protein [Cyanobacteria bacterium J06598_1]
MSDMPNIPENELPGSTASKLELSPEKIEGIAAFDVVLMAFVALGACLRFLWVGKRELWYDEVLSILLSSGQKNAYKLPDKVPFSVGDFAPLLNIPSESGISGAVNTMKNVVKGTLGDPHPPLFYLSEHGWMRLFGNGEGALRSLVMWMSLAAIGVAYLLGKRVLGRRGGLIFAALLSLNPFFLAHSLNLRMYTGMVFWTLVSGLGLLTLLTQRQRDSVHESAEKQTGWLLRLLVAGSITAGLLTQYLFAYWLFALTALVLYCDRKRWFQHGLTLGLGVLLFLPWAWWGVRQQINNRSDVLNQISAAGGPLQSALQHGKDLAQTLANHLLLGHLTTGMMPIADDIKPTAVAVGGGVIGFLVVCVVGLYRRRQYRVLMIAGLMGLVPLAVALGIDVLTGKYTLGFGWGRSTIVALPGCLLLVAAWLDLGTGRLREGLTVGLLVLYLAVNVGDFGGRDRQMFHQLSKGYIPETQEASLVVLNTRAWGHVLRLVYYIEEMYPGFDIDVLATDPADVTAALAPALAQKDYRTVLWLKADYPLWGTPETDEELAQLGLETGAFLQERLEKMKGPQVLAGTMKLDHFELQSYEAR